MVEEVKILRLYHKYEKSTDSHMVYVRQRPACGPPSGQSLAFWAEVQTLSLIHI